MQRALDLTTVGAVCLEVEGEAREQKFKVILGRIGG